jgi:hypothetical protein
MAPERLVLGRQERIDQLRREIDEAQLHAPLARIARHDLPIGTAHHRGQRRLVGQQRIGRRQRALHRHPQQAAQDQQHQHQPARAAEPLGPLPQPAQATKIAAPPDAEPSAIGSPSGSRSGSGASPRAMIGGRSSAIVAAL